MRFSPLISFSVCDILRKDDTLSERKNKMIKEKIDRINELAKKSKTPAGLTDAERAEQKALRDEYIAEYRAQFTGILENTYIQRPDGSKEKIGKKD